jgi:SAM-dependent methyltransferase
MSERERWTRLASAHPYWAVLDHPQYRADRLTPEDVRAFFDTGERDVANTLAAIQRVRPDFRPTRVLDYGCGVGRLTLPLARRSERAIGVDLSGPMLAEARRNAESQGVRNVEFVEADDFLNGNDARFAADLVYSYIVLQHVPPRIGMRITDTLLRRLGAGGMAALHYTYARRASLLRRVVNPLRRLVPGVNAIVNVVQRRPLLEPMIPMYEYDLAELFQAFQRHGCTSVHAELTDHGGHLGAMFLLEKSAEPPATDSARRTAPRVP